MQLTNPNAHTQWSAYLGPTDNIWDAHPLREVDHVVTNNLWDVPTILGVQPAIHRSCRSRHDVAVIGPELRLVC